MEERSCENCYWSRYRSQYCAWHKEEPEETPCKRHAFTCCSCESSKADFLVTHDNEPYCEDCLLEHLGVETFYVKHYMYDDQYLGDDNSMYEVFETLSDHVCLTNEFIRLDD